MGFGCSIALEIFLLYDKRIRPPICQDPVIGRTSAGGKSEYNYEVSVSDAVGKYTLAGVCGCTGK